MSISKSRKIIIAGGGTGGHVFPALSIAQNLVKQEINKEDIVFFGSKYSIEKDVIPKNGFKIYLFSGRGLNKTKSVKNLINAIGLILAFFKSAYLVLKINPSVVVGVGGYASFPAILSASIFRKKLIVHEQNAVIGRINKFAQKMGAQVITTFSETKGVKDNAIYLGLPLRDEVLNQISQRKDYLSKAKSKKTDKVNITIFGGSIGARCINNALIEMIDTQDVPSNWKITLITGEKNYVDIKNRLTDKQIEIYPFVDNLFERICRSDITISRAGAGSCVELEIAKVKSILIPLAIAPGDHQTKNANDLVKSGFGKIIQEKDLNAKVLKENISALLQNDIDDNNKLNDSIHLTAGKNIASYLIKNYLVSKVVT